MVGGGSRIKAGGEGGVICCPKCESTNIMPTGGSEIRNGVLCVEYICNDCGYKWWVSTTELKCPYCGSSDVESTGNIEIRKGVMWSEYECKNCSKKWWIRSEVSILRCPKCKSTNVIPTGKTKTDKNFTYTEWVCNECNHKWWVMEKTKTCPVCHSPIKSEILERKELEGGYTEIKTKLTCTNPNCTGTFQGEIKKPTESD